MTLLEDHVNASKVNAFCVFFLDTPLSINTIQKRSKRYTANFKLEAIHNRDRWISFPYILFVGFNCQLYSCLSLACVLSLLILLCQFQFSVSLAS